MFREGKNLTKSTKKQKKKNNNKIKTKEPTKTFKKTKHIEMTTIQKQLTI